ncbi:MAG TPA: ABC transporter permease [Spongiibacteraceae bacterium]|nr:ABC transporter permease [Spongiibacteraceae bacterium]
MRKLSNIFQLGVKELRSLWFDKALLIFIVWAFTGGVYSAATGTSRELNRAPIAIVDHDRSPLSQRIIAAFYPPHFNPPVLIDASAVDPALDAGYYTFVVDIPADFQRDVIAGKQPAMQVNIDATRMSQAFIGASYIQQITLGEVGEFLRHYRAQTVMPIELQTHVKFNPNLTGLWFGGVMEIMEFVTMLSIILTGAALIREREHGTVEHLLVMPLTPFEIMTAKVWANGLVVLVAAYLSLQFVIRGVLQVPITGSLVLFLCGAALYLFSTTALGIFLATIARSMPQLGLLVILTIMPLQILSGAVTPRESMPLAVQYLMQATPTTHFVALTQAIIYRGANFSAVWKDFVAIAAIGAVLFSISLERFRRTVAMT